MQHVCVKRARGMVVRPNVGSITNNRAGRLPCLVWMFPRRIQPTGSRLFSDHLAAESARPRQRQRTDLLRRRTTLLQRHIHACRSRVVLTYSRRRFRSAFAAAERSKLAAAAGMSQGRGEPEASGGKRSFAVLSRCHGDKYLLNSEAQRPVLRCYRETSPTSRFIC